MEPARIRQFAYATASFLLGAWAFVAVNAISGPAFEPIIAACTNPDFASVEDFVENTGYHEYEPMVGLGAFNLLVCLITQFLFELRTTHPAGVLTWGGVVLVSLPSVGLGTFEGARRGARGPIRYPVVLGLLYQLFGISVVFPLIFVPAFVFGEGERGAPLTRFRVAVAHAMPVPIILLTLAVFLAPTDSALWTTSAGILGGPILALMGLLFFFDKSSELATTRKAAEATSRGLQAFYAYLAVVGFLGWYALVGIAYQSYGTSFGDLWRDIWVEAKPSVAFMTIDTGVFYLAIVLLVAYRSGERMAAKAILRTSFLGPATALCLAMIEIEKETVCVMDEADKSTKKED